MTHGSAVGVKVHLKCLCVVCFALVLAETGASDDSERRRKNANDQAKFNTDDVINSIRGAFDTIFEYIGDQDGCKYTCPGGMQPKERKRHVPSSNGCGSFGLKLDVQHFPVIERCCDEHDVCYDTCNLTKEHCDDRFRDCLNDICKGIKKYVSTDIYDGCKSTADLMYAGTMALGCKPYRDSQKNACYCPGHSEL
ncbi:hypothetical protein BaRGS_00001575 [Batillaria attramentaria]|uniref:Group XIIA secretory phospholipase A2 n=1 Tax=Batillaria attramentaria TaxID=370345 RepID=A0ABD0M7D8_9CAEN